MPKLRKMGNVMLDAETVVLDLVYKRHYSWAKLMTEVYANLQQNHGSQQETYLDETNPKFLLTPNFTQKIASSRLSKIVDEMSKDHDLQWYEVLNLFLGYLAVHCPDKKDANFRFSYKA